MTFEYLVRNAVSNGGPEGMTQYLSQFGAEGWELVACNAIGVATQQPAILAPGAETQQAPVFQLIFKRQVPSLG